MSRLFSQNVGKLSYRAGNVARTRSECVQKNRWMRRDLVGSWLLELGNTGNTIPNGIKGNPVANLSNVAAIDAWTVIDGIRCLQFTVEPERAVAITTGLPVLGSTWFCLVRIFQTTSAIIAYGVNNNLGFIFITGGGPPAKLQVKVEVSAGVFVSMSTGFIIPLNEWHVVCLRMASSVAVTSDLSIFLDGVDVSTADTASGNPFQPNGELWMGSRFSGFPGQCAIGDILSYDNVWSDADIAEISRDLLAPFRRESIVVDIPSAPSVGNEGAAVYYHLQNLGVYS